MRPPRAVGKLLRRGRGAQRRGGRQRLVGRGRGRGRVGRGRRRHGVGRRRGRGVGHGCGRRRVGHRGSGSLAGVTSACGVSDSSSLWRPNRRAKKPGFARRRRPARRRRERARPPRPRPARRRPALRPRGGRRAAPARLARRPGARARRARPRPWRRPRVRPARRRPARRPGARARPARPRLLGGGALLGRRPVGRGGEGDLGPPARPLERDGPGGELALPFDRRLGLDPRDADLPELAQAAGEGGGVADLRPQLGRRLHKGALNRRLIGHRTFFRAPPGQSCRCATTVRWWGVRCSSSTRKPVTSTIRRTADGVSPHHHPWYPRAGSSGWVWVGWAPGRARRPPRGAVPGPRAAPRSRAAASSR